MRILLFILSLVSASCCLTYDEVIEAPRRSAAIANSAGTTVFTESSYSFNTRSWTTALKLVTQKDSKDVLYGDIGDIAWADSTHVLYLNGSSEYTSLWAVDVDTSDAFQVYKFPGSVELLKTRQTPNGLRVVVSGWASPDCKLVSPDAPKPADSGRLYDSLFVRHWDYWLSDARKALFGLLLTDFSVKEELTNYLCNTGIESPIMPFPSPSDFDLSDDKLVVNAKAPELNPANNTATYLYILEYKDTNTLTPVNERLGAASSPVFSPDGTKLAALIQTENGYESDQNLLFIFDLEKHTTANFTYSRSPSSVLWADQVYLVGEDTGRSVLWVTDLVTDTITKIPTTHSVEEVSVSNKKLLITASGIVKSTYYELYDPATGTTTPLLDAALSFPESRVGEFWFTGSRGADVHGFLIYPSDFDPTEKYPLAFLIHGGPQSAWTDSWSTRWNPLVWADNKKYVVVTINPTGSTGYGADFTDKIQNNWGSYPYIDLVLGLEYVLKEFKFIDTDRMIAAGASYGGYMVNWIQGSALGRVFKALVTHDGVFSTLNQYASDELYFPTHDFGGSFIENTRGYYKFNPMNRMYRWATPHFIVHNALDYRLPESEGLIAFNILQELGVPSKFLSFPDENHWVLKPENSRRWHKEIFDFINFHAGVDSLAVKTSAISVRELVGQIADSVRGDVVIDQ